MYSVPPGKQLIHQTKLFLFLLSIGDNWFNDALCVLADVVFFFIPEYLMGPRLIPLLILILIIAHLMLPVFHGFSFILVYSYYRLYVNPSSQEFIAAARAGTTHNSATPINYADEDYKASAPSRGTGSSAGHRLCQKCQSRQSGENGGVVVDRCSSTPLLKPIETTC